MAVSKLRKALGAEAIHTTAGGYTMVVDDEDVDARRFELLVDRARVTMSNGDTETAVALFGAALSEWRGEPFVDVPAGELLTVEVARLSELRLGAIEDFAGARLAQGQHVELVAELGDLVATHPFRERLHGHLIRALYRSGRQADALAAYSRVRELLVEQLGVDPSPELAMLEQQVLGQDERLAAPERMARRSGSLPIPLTGMVGRDGELKALRGLLENGTRLITLTGPGGSGKTRLSIGVAAAVTRLYADGVFFIPLVAATTQSAMWVAIAQSLGISPDGHAPPAFFDYLGSRRVLLVLDNLEQLDGAAAVVADLLAGADGVTVLATSRRPMHVPGEHEHQVPPLPLPTSSTLEGAQASGAVQMFVEHANRAGRTFSLTRENAADVTDLCRALDGLPLALELAAVRTKVLSPKALLSRVDTALDLGSPGDARPDRQRTLRAAIAWSHQLLEPTHQGLFRRLAIFAGGASLSAIEAVTPSDVTGDREPLDVLFDLVDVSLLAVEEVTDGEPRFYMLETIRRFAIDELEHHGELQTARDRHAQHFYDLAKTLLELKEISGQSANARARFLGDLDNFRDVATRRPSGVWDREAGVGPLPETRVCAVIVDAALDADRLQDALDWTYHVLDGRDPSDLAGYSECLRNLAHAHIVLGHVDLADASASECIDVVTRLMAQSSLASVPAWFDPTHSLSMSHTMLGHLRRLSGDLAAARAEADWGPALDELPPVRQNEVLALQIQIESDARDFDKAIGYLDRKMKLNLGRQDDTSTAWDQAMMCFFELAGGRRAAAAARLPVVVDTAAAAGDPIFILDAADMVALALGPDRPESAGRLIAAIELERDVKGRVRTQASEIDFQEHLAAIRMLVEDNTWERATELGRESSVDELVAEMLGRTASHP